MVEPFDLSCNGLEVLGFHVEDEDGDIEVADLFELAKLDAPESEINMEPFNIGELIQDIIQKYKLVFEKKKINLRAEFPKEIPLVNADI